jgi:hypothetical protein
MDPPGPHRVSSPALAPGPPQPRPRDPSRRREQGSPQRSYVGKRGARPHGLHYRTAHGHGTDGRADGNAASPGPRTGTPGRPLPRLPSRPSTQPRPGGPGPPGPPHTVGGRRSPRTLGPPRGPAEGANPPPRGSRLCSGTRARNVPWGPRPPRGAAPPKGWGRGGPRVPWGHPPSPTRSAPHGAGGRRAEGAAPKGAS